MNDIQSITAENCIIGCIMLGDNEGEIFTAVNTEDFQSEAAVAVFENLREYWQKHGKVDDVAVVSIDKIYRKFMTLCMDTVPSLSSWETYVNRLREEAIIRRSGVIGFNLAMNGVTLEEVQAYTTELARIVNGAAPSESLPMKRGILNFLGEKRNPREYIKTGFARVDRYTFIDKGDFIVLGGRPSSGKTAFSITLALNMARAGHKIVYFSLETAPQKLMDRIMTTACELDFNKVKRQTMDEEEWEKVALCSDNLANLPLEIVPASGKTVAWIHAEALRRKADIAFIDYIGLIHSEGAGRYEKMTNISMGIHEFCQQTKITVIGLSQLNRKDAEAIPSMENIRESGQIEQDADVIILLHNSSTYRVIIAKNKEGETGDVNMYFDGAHQSFWEEFPGEV